MKVRELTNGELDACRQKATSKVVTFLETIKTLSETERFGKLCQKFEKMAQCTALCADNFDPVEFVERGNENLEAIDLEIMKKSHVEGVHVMGLLRDAMAAMPQSKINGTSSIFAQYAENAGYEAIWLAEGCKTPRRKISSPLERANEITVPLPIAV